MLIRIYLLVAHAELPAGPYCFTGCLRERRQVEAATLASAPHHHLEYIRLASMRDLTHRSRFLQRTPNSRLDAPARLTRAIIKVAPPFVQFRSIVPLMETTEVERERKLFVFPSG